jgi:hypothetical protein
MHSRCYAMDRRSSQRTVMPGTAEVSTEKRVLMRRFGYDFKGPRGTENLPTIFQIRPGLSPSDLMPIAYCCSSGHNSGGPLHGFIVCRDATWHRIENDAELRGLVLEVAGQIRAAKANVSTPVLVHPRSN